MRYRRLGRTNLRVSELSYGAARGAGEDPAGHLPAGPPYTSTELWGFLQPYGIPEAALRYVLAQDVSTCCVGFRREERLRENLRALDPPYLDEARQARARELFGRIARQVR